MKTIRQVIIEIIESMDEQSLMILYRFIKHFDQK